ncbi:MAG TPA: ATP-binding protein [Gemmatimonas sp.]|nr:ATP-binding protein [Gemmatimonas sp.]
MERAHPPRTTRSTTRLRTLRATVIAAIAFGVVALSFDGWYRSTLVKRERERVRASATPFAGALQSSVERRLSRLAGLKTLVETRRQLGDIRAEFDSYAEALSVGVPGVRALQLVDSGRIVATRPSVDSSRLHGYDLYRHPVERVRKDVDRALGTDSIVITGPLELLQGGRGLVARQRVRRAESDAPQLVVMVIDLPAVVSEARAIASAPPSVSITLRDRADSVVDGGATLDDPITVPVHLPDGTWHVDAAPSEGWAAAVASDLRPTRIALALIMALLLWLTYVLFGRQERLTLAVANRTEDLEHANRELQREIHTRQGAEERLRGNDERLRLALVSGRMGTWEYDARDDMVYWSKNAMALLGGPAVDTTEHGADFLRAVPSEFHESIAKAVGEAKRGSRAMSDCRAEFRYTLPDGSERWLYASGELQAGAHDLGDRLVGVIVDITERRHLEEQLLQSQKMEAVGTLAGGIAHDFNNLLTAILGFAQLSQMQAAALDTESRGPALRAGLDELRTDLDEIVKAGERASLLTGQLLAFSRRQVHKPTRVDINGVVREVERMLVRLIGERITLEPLVSSHPLPVLADPGQVAQVIVNLVVNARDALPSGGVIKLRTDRLVVAEGVEPPISGLGVGTWVLVAVEDNGTGMSPEVMARIFEPFFTTKRVGEGTGLGLSTVYGIVTQGGGRVTVQSAVDVGTTVQVALPLHLAASGTAPQREAGALQQQRAAHVLVVEDEPGLRRLVAEILTRRGYTVEVASDGLEALTALDGATTPPDLVLSDVVMPRLGGRALADEIVRRGMTIPVLFMSGYPAGEELPEDEAHTFIGKPFTPDALVRKVRALLERV